MSGLFYKDTPIIGLDISHTGVKMMSIDTKKWLVLGYGAVDLSPVHMQESLNGEASHLADAIKRLIAEDFKGVMESDHVAIGVPTARTFARSFTIPASSEKKLREAVELEVDQYIPAPISTLYVDYEIADRNKTTKELTVMMTATPKMLVDNAIAATELAGLKPVLVEPSMNAVARLLRATESGNLPTVIVDIGQTTTDIAIIDGHVRITGGVAIGGNNFTLAIAKTMNVPLENAHQLKVLNGLSQSQYQARIVASVKPSIDRIIAETRRVMRYYNERMNTNAVTLEQVLVVGGGSNVPGIGDYFTNELVMPSRVAIPWEKLNFGQLESPSKQFRPRYISVAGLASAEPSEILR